MIRPASFYLMKIYPTDSEIQGIDLKNVRHNEHYSMQWTTEGSLIQQVISFRFNIGRVIQSTYVMRRKIEQK